jgi:hypothetical protein
MKSLLKNWKTTLAGALSLAAVLAPIWAPADIASKIQATAGIFAASGLVVSRDHNI